MSRVLKFRAWSNEHNRYCDFVTLDENGRWIGWIKSSGVYLTTVDIILEQYTGLKDKNGKKIYVGDILLDDSGEPLEYWEVKFYDGKYVGETIGEAVGIVEDLYELIDFEVVGNIHENKELMEGEE